MKSVPTCSYIKVNGLLCGSPALRRSRFCYYHDADRKQRSQILHAASLRERARYAMPTASQCRAVELTDLHTPRGLQRALNTIIQAVWNGSLDSDSARAMLHAIEMIRRDAFSTPPDPAVFESLAALLASTTPPAAPHSRAPVK